MLRRLAISGLAFLTWLCALDRDANATFDLWGISEVYTNADGSVQFIELFTAFDGQQQLSTHTVTTNANTFTFPTNLAGSTANQHLLIATPGFASLPGAVVPDFTLPVTNFFSAASDTIRFAPDAFPPNGVDFVNISNASTDGVNSLNYPGGDEAVNSPTNFAGDVGKLVTLGDFNEDGTVNSFDADLFVEVLLNCAAFHAAHPTIDAVLVGDLNEDGTFNLGDVDPFIALLGSPVSASAVPEPNTFLIALIALAGVAGRRREVASRGRGTSGQRAEIIN